MKALKKLRTGTSLDDAGANRRLLEVLTENKAERENIAIQALAPDPSNDNDSPSSHWGNLKEGKYPLTFTEMAAILAAFEKQGFRIDPSGVDPGSPLSQQAFYDALRQGILDAEIARNQLEKIYEESKREKGFLANRFNVFANKNPLEKTINNVAEFDKYCRKNGITFDEISQQLVPGQKPKTPWDKIKEFRFLIAAAGGTAAGIAGMNPIEAAPMLGEVPGFFFKALPYIALPFISLSIFRAFSEKSIVKEAGTFARFGFLMSTGVLIGLGVTSAMAGFMPNLESAKEAVEIAKGAASFSPSQYILHGIGAAAIFAGLYKSSKSRLSHLFSEKGAIKWADAQPRNIPGLAIVKTGKGLLKTAGVVDKGFIQFMNVVGIPAIFLMLANTIDPVNPVSADQGGLAALSKYAGYYATMGVATVVGSLALAGLAFANGARKKEFGEMAKTASTAFSISSSAATMPVTKQALKNMGVSSAIREAIVPLGANFNMYGTALYLGTTAACSTVMFGMDPTIGQLAGVLGMSVLTAFGAPGAPASTIIFLDPVLAKAGLTPEQAAKIYEMVLPIDRPADMWQTAANVTGDQVTALNTEAWEKNKGWRKILPLRRNPPSGPM